MLNPQNTRHYRLQAPVPGVGEARREVGGAKAQGVLGGEGGVGEDASGAVCPPYTNAYTYFLTRPGGAGPVFGGQKPWGAKGGGGGAATVLPREPVALGSGLPDAEGGDGGGAGTKHAGHHTGGRVKVSKFRGLDHCTKTCFGRRRGSFPWSSAGGTVGLDLRGAEDPR
jgi:hypothetical protein